MTLAMTRRLLVREETFAAAIAAALAAGLLWAAPPGVDWAGHAYQTTFLVEHGFAIWNNFWYAGRYSFVTYSVLYYPLAGLIGIRMLAVVDRDAAHWRSRLILRQWGSTARMSSRTFAVVSAGIAFPQRSRSRSGALALLALCALQDGRHGRFAVLAADPRREPARVRVPHVALDGLRRRSATAAVTTRASWGRDPRGRPRGSDAVPRLPLRRGVPVPHL